VDGAWRRQTSANQQPITNMEYEIALTSIFILVLVVTATAKNALDELSRSPSASTFQSFRLRS
jgi:hypothetical protein